MALPGPTAEGRNPGARIALGLILLLIAGLLWAYTLLLFGGAIDSLSGPIGTNLFLLGGLPGLTMTAIGAVNLLSERRWRRAG